GGPDDRGGLQEGRVRLRGQARRAGAGGGMGWRRVFIGPNGLRAGWSLLVFGAAGFLLEGAIGWAVTRLGPGPGAAPWTPGLRRAGGTLFVASALVLTLLMGRIESRSLADYGFPLRRAFGARFWEGAGWGLGSCALVYVLMAAARGYTLHGLAVEGAAAL